MSPLAVAAGRSALQVLTAVVAALAAALAVEMYKTRRKHVAKTSAKR